jgi:hypothetical protein
MAMHDCMNPKHVQSNFITFKENIQLFQSTRTWPQLAGVVRGPDRDLFVTFYAVHINVQLSIEAKWLP